MSCRGDGSGHTVNAGYDYQPCRQSWANAAHAWGNQSGQAARVHRAAQDRGRVRLALPSTVIVCGRLVRRAWTHYRWAGRPRRRPRLPTGAASWGECGSFHQWSEAA